MPTVRITRRIVDPVTFCESVDLEFLPRGLEDSILDEAIGMAYNFPPHKSKREEHYHSPSQSPVPDSSVPALQQCSDEESSAERELEELSASDFSSSSSKDDESSAERELEALPDSELSSSEEEELPTNLLARPPSPPIPGSPVGKSPRRSPRLRKKLSIMESSQNTVDDDASINPEEDLGGFKPPKDDGKKQARFADEVDINQFSRFGASLFDDLYYASNDLAEFRYAAFMEEAGLDIADYD
jgi:hypothetical protein